MPPELSGFGLPQDLVQKAKELLVARKEKGQSPVSDKVAVALVMKDQGTELLKEISSGTDGSMGIAPDISSVISGLSPSARTKFLDGLGQVLLGSILQSVEEGFFGWDDYLFVEHFNRGVVGTAMPTLKVDNLIKGINPSLRRTTQQETDIIRRELVKDPRFLSFLEPVGYALGVLPQVVGVLFQEPIIHQAFFGGKVIKTYKEAVQVL